MVFPSCPAGRSQWSPNETVFLKECGYRHSHCIALSLFPHSFEHIPTTTLGLNRNVSREQIQAAAIVGVTFPRPPPGKPHSRAWARKPVRWNVPFWAPLDTRMCWGCLQRWCRDSCFAHNSENLEGLLSPPRTHSYLSSPAPFTQGNQGFSNYGPCAICKRAPTSCPSPAGSEPLVYNPTSMSFPTSCIDS